MNLLKNHINLASLLQTIIEEDVSEAGDVTTLATVSEDRVGTAKIVAKQPGVIAGNWVAEKVFTDVEPQLEYVYKVEDGISVTPGTTIAEIFGSVRGILTAERSALNLLGRLCGVATVTRKFVERVAGTNAKILDTRKTTPGLRFLEKYAVTVGGGHNHRFGLSDMILIKENHILASGGIRAAIERCRKYIDRYNLQLKIEVETTNLKEVEQAMVMQVDRIMLDNMTQEMVKQAVSLVNQQVELEVSGGVTLENVHDLASTGVDYISVGGLTHSVTILDLSLLLV